MSGGGHEPLVSLSFKLSTTWGSLTEVVQETIGRAWRAGQVVGTYPNGERMVSRKGWVELVIPVLASM